MREPHFLNKTKSIRIPKRVIFFDSESEVQIEITDEEVYRASEGEKVTKEHTPYLICATFHSKRKGESPRETDRVYHGRTIRGVDYPQGKENFLLDFWMDVASFTSVTEKVYLFAHNAKYDIQVTGGISYLVKLGFTVVSFTDDNPTIINLEKYITHSPRTGKPYGDYLFLGEKEVKEVTDREYPDHKKPVDQGDGLWFFPEPKVKALVIVSSTNYYQQSLKKLGEVFGIKKLDFDHDQPFTLEEAITYCKVDVKILRHAMLTLINFIIAEDLGSFSLTVAGQAFSAFRHRFMEEDQIRIHSDKRALEVERRAYAGGRTECFFMGEVPGKVHYVDVNSMYPAAMKEFLYPIELVTFWEQGTLEQLKSKIQDDYLICCDARINTNIRIFHKKQKRLIFPVGDYWTSLSTPELIEALDRGILTEVKNIAIYKSGNIFELYVNYFYNKRLEMKKIKDKIHDFLFKLFLNCLYGKFGQKNIQYEIVGEADPEKIDYIQVYHPDTKERETFKIFGGKVWKRKEDPDNNEAYNSFPAVASHVTAYARMMLWKYMETAGIENVYYCDTDSLLMNDVGYANLMKAELINDQILGKLKLEKEGRLTLYGCKDYTFNEVVSSLNIKRKNKLNPNHGQFFYYFKSINGAVRRVKGRRYSPLNRNYKLINKKLNKFEVKIKGVSKFARKLPNSDQGKLRFAVTQWGGFTDRLKAKSFTEYYNKVIIKELNRDYNKGVVEGSSVTPYHLNHVQEMKDEYEKYLIKENKEFNAIDHITELCKIHGYIKVIKKGEYYYDEYIHLNKKARVKYFRLNGIPLDVWCAATEQELNLFLEKIKIIK